MKLILLAAAAFLATPALAQSTGGAGSGTPVGPDAKTPAANEPMPQSTTPAQDPTMSQPAPSDPNAMSQPAPADPNAMSTQPAPTDPNAMSTQPAPMSSGGSMTTGGYQPTTAPTAGTFQQAPSVEQAYPAPAPLASYPICKKGQYDKCMQRGGR